MSGLMRGGRSPLSLDVAGLANGTQPLYGDYALHYASVVQNTPPAACQR